METQTETLKQSQLIGRLVLDRSTTEEVGKVDQLWLDTKTHEVLGLLCKSGGLLGGKKQIFKWTQVSAIGDSIMLDMSSGPVEEIKPDQLDRIVGHELWTDGGNKAGKLLDYLFDPKTGKVINYIFTSSGLTGIVDGSYLLSPEIIDNVGSKRVIVSQAAVAESEQYEGGVGTKISKAGEFLQEDAKKTHQDLKAVQGGLQAALGQFKDKAGTVAERAKETAKETAGQFKEKAGTVAERAKETATETAGQFKERAGTVAERAKETAKETAGQFKERAGTVAEQAKKTATETAGQFKERAGTVAERAKETAKETAGQFKEKAGTMAEQAKKTATETAGQLKDKADQVVEKAKSPKSDDRQTLTPMVIEVEAEAVEEET